MKTTKRFGLRTVIVLLICSILVTSLITYVATYPSTSYSTIIEAGSMNTEASYIFFVDESIYYVRNGTTGEIVYSGTNCTYIVQSVIDNHPTDALWIHFTYGNYCLHGISVTKSLHVSGELPLSFVTEFAGTILTLDADAPMFYWNHTDQVFGALFENIELRGENRRTLKSVDWWGDQIGKAPLIEMNSHVSDVIFSHVMFFESGTEAIRIISLDSKIWNIWIIDSWIESSYGLGIWLHVAEDGEAVERIHIRGNHFYDNNYDIGISSDKVSDVIIDDNTSEMTNKAFLHSITSRDLTVANNHIYDAGYNNTGNPSNAINVNGSRFSKFIGNTVRNFRYSAAIETGMSFTYCNFTIISNNIIYNVTSDGIKLDTYTSWSLLTGNIVYNNGGYGIFIEDATCEYNAITSCTAAWNGALQILDQGTNSEIHSCWNGTSWIT